MERIESVKGTNEDIAILVDLSTGLAIKRTKPRRVPHKYIDSSVKDVINYIVRTIEQEGSSEDTMLATNIQDHMKSRQYVIKIKGQNINPGDNFGKVVEKCSDVESIEGNMRYRDVSMVITRVEEGGDRKDL